MTKTVNKTLAIAFIVGAFLVGSITTGAVAFGVPGEQGKPFEFLQKQIDDIIDGTVSIEGSPGIMTFGSISSTTSFSPKYSCPAGFTASTPLTECSLTVPINGKLKEFTASSQHNGSIISPGIGESYLVTIVKNGVDTLMTCTISNNESFCQSTTNSVEVVVGDRLDLKLDVSSNPKESRISGSVLITK